MLYLPHRRLQLLTAAVAVNRTKQVLSVAVLADLRLRIYGDRLSAARTEPGMRRKIFVAGRAPVDDYHLMAALRAESGINRNLLLAIGTDLQSE